MEYNIIIGSLFLIWIAIRYFSLPKSNKAEIHPDDYFWAVVEKEFQEKKRMQNLEAKKQKTTKRKRIRRKQWITHKLD